ncbi:hypothetical protein A2U01_0064031, partial [Trifolium medium]|nr:hypothetical protein [Trifolium medium]
SRRPPPPLTPTINTVPTTATAAGGHR